MATVSTSPLLANFSTLNSSKTVERIKQSVSEIYMRANMGYIAL